MKISYDSINGTLYICLQPEKTEPGCIDHSELVADDVIAIDHLADGSIYGVEFLCDALEWEGLTTMEVLANDRARD